MTSPTTITELLNAMQSFVDKGKDINASDITFEAKQLKLEQLSEELGLA